MTGEPISTTALILMGIGGGIKAGGTVMQSRNDARTAQLRARNESAQLRASAEEDEENARISRQLGDAAANHAAARAADFESEGSKRAAAARSVNTGFAMTGSKLLVAEEDFTKIEFGKARLKAQGRLERTRRNQEADFRARNAIVKRISAQDIVRQGGKTARNIHQAGLLSATGQLFSLGGSLAGKAVNFG